MSFFGGSRRHRPPNPSLIAATTNPNAATAAASAFMRREPNTSLSLSSAAAAAALKARPTTPTNVAEVQTKRTRQRSASVSSTGSDGRPGLQRSGSTGSMTERTFRSPSPHRNMSAKQVHVPPVPTIPDDVQSLSSVGDKRENQRSPPGLQMQSFRVASHKLKDGEGSWFGPAATGDPSNVRTSDAILNARQRSVSPSINFSYPRGSRMASPPPSPKMEKARPVHRRTVSSPKPNVRPSSITSDQDMVFDPNTRRMVTRAELRAVEQSIRDAEEKSIKKRKDGDTRSGSHLARGTTGRTKVSTVRPDERAPRHTEAIKKPPPRQVQPTSQRHAELDLASGPIVASPGIERAGRSGFETDRPKTWSFPSTEPLAPFQLAETGQPPPILGKKPSTVREEPELDVTEPDIVRIAPQQRILDALDSVPVRTSAPPRQAIPVEQSPMVELPAEGGVQEEESRAEGEPKAPEMKHPDNVRLVRTHSNSPVRAAHFAPTTDRLVVRHSPPPRAASPRKSAMKHSSPSRGDPTSDDGSETSSTARPDVEGSSAPPQEDLPRKKGTRVSFNDESIVVGQAAPTDDTESPVLLSPQAKRPWYNNMGRSKKKDSLLEEDEVMKPRPALPSFDSVREKKVREVEERPLVRPHEPAHSPSLPSSPAMLSATDVTSELQGQSSDHAVGAVLSHDFTARNEANISKFREPLPPVVTSIEGSGYVSNESSSEDDYEPGQEIVTEPEPAIPAEQTKEEIIPNKGLNGSTKHPEAQDAEVPYRALEAHETAPSISITPSSPSLTDKSPVTSGAYFDLPGGFPEDESDGRNPPSVLEKGKGVDHSHQDKHVDSVKGGISTTTPATLPTTSSYAVQDDDSSSEGSSIYSDAYEDLSDIDGDGFISLDAAVASNIPPKVSQRLYDEAMAGPRKESAPDTVKQVEVVKSATAPPSKKAPDKPVDDWEAAKSYWRSLTAEKRRQLEREAREEAGEQADLEEAAQVNKKAKKKKSTERQQHAATQMVSRQWYPERTYQIRPGTKVPNHRDDTIPTGTDPRRGPTASKLRKSMRGDQAGSLTGPEVSFSQPVRQDSQAPASVPDRMQKTMKAVSGSAASGRVGTGQPLGPKGHTRVGSDGAVPRSTRTNNLYQADDQEARRTITKGARPFSYPPQSAPQDDRRTQASASEAGRKPPTAMSNLIMPSLKRQDSGSSKSSFKRDRPRFESLGFGFRKTMRSSTSPPASPGEAKSGGRFSFRSFSPQGSPFRRGAGALSTPPLSIGNRMRKTLRDDSSEESKHRVRIPTFGRSSGIKALGKRPKFASRFGDSSEEDEPVSGTFKSRFADSSDEDNDVPVVPLPTSATMPKTMRPTSSSVAEKAPAQPPTAPDDAESSELPDSSDEEEKQKAARKAPLDTGNAPPKPQSNFASGSIQRKRSGRGGLLNSTNAPALGTQAMSGSRSGHSRRSSLIGALRRKKGETGKISRPELTESAARRDTKLERSVDQLTAIRGTTTSPRLENSQAGGGWPLPDEDEEEEEEDQQIVQVAGTGKTLPRPATAGTLTTGSSLKPSFFKRRSTSEGILSFGRNEKSEAELGKKKKFGTLRRMLGLEDQYPKD